MKLEKTIKKVMPKWVFIRRHEILPYIRIIVLRFCSKNGFLSSIYYTFASTEFYREHRAVLLGKLSYEETLVDIGESSSLLRRNIHRIEKGLIMRPRKKVFAEEYIQETVQCFLQCVEYSNFSSDESKWAQDVLNRYFSVVGESDILNNAKKLFSPYIEPGSSATSIPYPHSSLPEIPISYEELMQLFLRRRSVRFYQNKPVEFSLIEKAVQAATLAPSACNRQSFQFYATTNENKATDIAKCALGTGGFAENIPCIVAVIGDLSAYPGTRDRHVIYIDASLAVMQLMLSFETLGLSTCPINWPDIEEHEAVLSKKLDLLYHQRVIMLVAVGYADREGGIPFSAKKSSVQLLRKI